MEHTHESSRRVVSKGEYARVQAKRAGKGILGRFSVLLSFLTGYSAVAFISDVAAARYSYFHSTIKDNLAVCVVSSGLITIASLLWRSGLANIKKASENNVVPLTRANTAALSASDSLVRASSEPIQAQRAVLLRASGQAQERQKEQLLRAANGMENSGR